MKHGRPPELTTIPEKYAWDPNAPAAVAARALHRAAWCQYKKVRAGHRGAAYNTGKGSKREFIVDLCCGTATLGVPVTENNSHFEKWSGALGQLVNMIK